MSISGAFTKEKRNSDHSIVLTHYCRLYLQSPDSVWKSQAINTIICHDLHTNLILGLNFLVRNQIVVDATLHSAVAKETNYDLLNPPDPTLLHKELVTTPAKRHKEEA